MARIVSQAVDELGNLYFLKDDGILEKRSPSNTLLWSQQTRQEPTTGNFVFANHAALDLDNNVWLTYSDVLNIQVRSGATGLLVVEVLGTASNVLVSQTGGANLYALSTSRGILYEIPRSTKVLGRSIDLSEKVPGYNDGVFATQIASSLSEDIWLAGLIGPVGEDKTAALIRFDPAGTGAFTCHPMTGVLNVPVVAVGADDAGFIYASTLHGTLFRFNEDVSVNAFDASYDPLAPGGVTNIVSFTNDNNLVLVDDGTFAFAGQKTRFVSRADGFTLSSLSSSSVGTIQGDPLGYHHIKLTRINVPPVPITPIADSNKLDVFVKPDGTISFTGRPGATFDALSIQCIRDAVPLTPVGTVVPNPDGSFSVTSAPGTGAPAGEPCTIKLINGATVVSVGINSQPRSLPVAFDVQFQTSGFALTGQTTRLKAKITDGVSGPVVGPTPTQFPIFRLKRDSDGKWFNGTSYVADNGDYLQPSFDVDGQFWFADVDLPSDTVGHATFLVKDSPPYTTNLILLPEISNQATLTQVQSVVNELNNRVDIAFGAPAGSFTDPATIGGFLLEKINDIQKQVRIIKSHAIGQRNVQIESILVDVSRQSVAKGSTPAIDITVYDADRRFPLDISGARIFLKVKVNLASPVLIIDREGVVIDGPTGQARVKLTAQDTAVPQRLSAQVVAEIPGTGTLLSPPFIFDILDSVL